MSRFVRPETVRLGISNGDWLLVKKRLTAGEQRQVFVRLMKPFHPALGNSTPNGGQTLEIDPIQASLSTILGYLVDWSLVDEDGKPVVIRGRQVQEVIAALDALDMESFQEIQQAIQEHEAAEGRARREANATPFGATVSLPT